MEVDALKHALDEIDHIWHANLGHSTTSRLIDFVFLRLLQPCSRGFGEPAIALALV
jgi:hypothetical protein